MFIFTSSLIILLNIIVLVLSNPVDQVVNPNLPKDPSVVQAFREANKILNRYHYLVVSDNDHLVHGMLQVLLNNPTSFPYIPPRALDLALKNLEQKLGHTDVEILIKPLLLTIEHHHATKIKPPTTTVKLTDETKQKIEEALDKFLDDESFPARL